MNNNNYISGSLMLIKCNPEALVAKVGWTLLKLLSWNDELKADFA